MNETRMNEVLEKYKDAHGLRRAVEVAENCNRENSAMFNLVSEPLTTSNAVQLAKASKELGITEWLILDGNAQTFAALALIEQYTFIENKIAKVWYPYYSKAFEALHVYIV